MKLISAEELVGDEQAEWYSLTPVRALLMGGQACVLYGAAEFSRDIDFAIVSDPANLSRLRWLARTAINLPLLIATLIMSA